MIPEFVSRLSIRAILNRLTVNDLVKTLIEPRNSITSQYQKIFMHNNIKLDFSMDALHSIAEVAFQFNTGARALKSILV